MKSAHYFCRDSAKRRTEHKKDKLMLLHNLHLGNGENKNDDTDHSTLFTYAGPAVWNLLPDNLRRTPTINSFKHKLKTYLFISASS